MWQIEYSFASLYQQQDLSLKSLQEVLLTLKNDPLKYGAWLNNWDVQYTAQMTQAQKICSLQASTVPEFNECVSKATNRLKKEL